MDQDIAEHFAAVELRGVVTAGQVKVIVENVLRRLATCAFCNDSGKITYPDGAKAFEDGGAMHIIPAGASGECPYCGGAGDPKFLRWHCYGEQPRTVCEPIHDDERHTEHRDHLACGLRVLLPLPLPLPIATV